MQYCTSAGVVAVPLMPTLPTSVPIYRVGPSPVPPVPVVQVSASDFRRHQVNPRGACHVLVLQPSLR